MKAFEKIDSFVRRYSDVRVILLCFLAATTFWFFNALNDTYSASINYPITFSYNEEDYIVMEELPDEVYLNLEGIGWNLFRKSLGIKVTPLRIYLEEPSEINVIAGSSLPAIISDQLAEFNLNYVLTDSLYIKIDRKVKKTFIVKIDSAAINVAEDHIITSPISFNPDSVTLVGPASILEPIGDTLVLNIPENKISSDYDEEVPITFNKNELVRKQPEFISVGFNVEELIERELEVNVKATNLPRQLILADSLVNVEIRVKESRLGELTPEDIDVVADFRNFNPEDSTIIPTVRFYPNYVNSVQVDTVGLKVTRKKTN
ncbi:MAG: hypothetical protein ACNS60_12640 [Candidatus Cyclobacteriaceae bacterium M2_1C_046]